jgi:hypothetical protein
MKTTFRSELVALQAAAGSSVETRSLLQDQKVQMEKLMLMFQRRTAALSPTQGFSTATYSRRGKFQWSSESLLAMLTISVQQVLNNLAMRSFHLP